MTHQPIVTVSAEAVGDNVMMAICSICSQSCASKCLFFAMQASIMHRAGLLCPALGSRGAFLCAEQLHAGMCARHAAHVQNRPFPRLAPGTPPADPIPSILGQVVGGSLSQSVHHEELSSRDCSRRVLESRLR